MYYIYQPFFYLKSKIYYLKLKESSSGTKNGGVLLYQKAPKTPLLILLSTYIYWKTDFFTIYRINMNKNTPLLPKDIINKGEKYITLWIYYLLPIIIIVTLISATLTTNNIGFSWQEFRGNRGRKLLSIVLFIKPITFLGRKYLNAEEISIKYFIQILKELPKKIKNNPEEINSNAFPKYIFPFLRDSIYSISLYLMKFRRQLGVAAFWFLLTHGMLWQIFRARQGFSLFFNIGNTAIWTWIIALIALLIGAGTSNSYAMKKLQKNRKNIQMVAYWAFFFGAIHTEKTFWLIVYFIVKYFERRDTGLLNLWKQRGIQQWKKIITHPQTIKLRNTIKNNKKISEIRAKICKK